MEARVTIENRGSAWGVYVSAFLLPALMFLGICAVLGLLPFGSTTVFTPDMTTQYIYYYSALGDALRGDGSLLYSFGKTLGGGMLSLAAYYLMSPFAVLASLVPKSELPTAVTYMMAVKLGLCGLCMSVLLTKLWKQDYAVLLFSTGYALMSYNMVYISNIMWLDGVYMLPIVILGLEKLVRGEKIYTYTLSLSYCLITNYYIGYMICLFSVLFFAYRAAVELLEGRKNTLRLIVRFALASLMAGGIASAILVPTAIQLAGTKATVDPEKLKFRAVAPWKYYFSKFFADSRPNDISEGSTVLADVPEIYCGALINALIPLYFFNKKINGRRRVASAVLLVVLTLSFYINTTYVIWHAMNYPACFNYRNAFLFSFVMVYLAWQSYIHRDGIDLRCCICAAIIPLAVLALLVPLRGSFVSRKTALFEVVFTCLVYLTAVLSGKKKKVKLMAILIAVLQLVIVFENALYLKNQPVYYFDSEDFASVLERRSGIVDRIEENDGAFYRIGNSGDKNEPMQIGYNGISHFSSTEQTELLRFVAKFGFSHLETAWSCYEDGATPEADAFLGVKYMIGNAERYGSDTLFTEGGDVVSQNPNALDIAMVSDRASLDFTMDGDDIFEWQNGVFSSVLGHEAKSLIKETDVGTELVNLTGVPYEDGGTAYYVENNSEPSSVIYRFTADSDRPVYIYTTHASVPGDVSARLYVNGEDRGLYMGSYNWKCFNIGSFEPGESVEIELRPVHDYFLMTDTYIYYQDMDALESICDEIRAGASDAEIVKLSPTHLRWHGSIEDDGKVLLFTVPYDSGWTAEIDGKPAELQKAMEALMAAELSRGEHTVELYYYPRGFNAGIAITVISLCVLAVSFVFEKKKKKN